MFSAGTLVNVPQFRKKPLLVVGSDGHNSRCLWSNEDGTMGEVLIPTSLLQELQPAASTEKSNLDETLPSDWLRKNATR